MIKRHITVVIDRSGSMIEIKEDTEGGLKAFLGIQREDTESEVTVTLYEFSHRVRAVFTDLPIADVRDYKLRPDDLTALHDAVGTAVLGLPDKDTYDERVVLVLTDGEENASREHTGASVKKLVKAARKDGVVFQFLGAEQDAVLEARNLGMDTSTALTYTKGNVRLTMETASHTVLRGSRTGDYGFTGDEREEATRDGC